LSQIIDSELMHQREGDLAVHTASKCSFMGCKQSREK